MMSKKKIKRILENQDTIEGMSNPFNKDIFFELLEIHFWVKFLERNGTLTKEEVETVKNWEKSKDDKKKNKVINEVYEIMENT